MRALLAAGADVREMEGGTPALVYAAQHGQGGAVELLAEHGAAQAAASGGSTGAPIDIADRQGRSALLAVCGQKATTGGSVEGLSADLGEDSDDETDEGGVPRAASAVAERAAKRAGGANVDGTLDQLPMLMLLLRLGAALDFTDDSGSTGLHIAAAAGDEAVARFLLQRGCATERQNQRGYTATKVAIDRKCIRIVRAIRELSGEDARQQAQYQRDFEQLTGGGGGGGSGSGSGSGSEEDEGEGEGEGEEDGPQHGSSDSFQQRTPRLSVNLERGGEEERCVGGGGDVADERKGLMLKGGGGSGLVVGAASLRTALA